MITYDEMITKDLPSNSSGIDKPQNYLWARNKDNNVYYPKVRIVAEIKVSGYENGKFQLEVKCISAVNHETEVADYSYFYCEWDSTNLQGDAFEWQWRGADADACPPFYEEVQQYIERAFMTNEIKAPTNQATKHLEHMVGILEELQSTDLIHLQEDMPQEYGKFVLAKTYLKRLATMLLLPLMFISCQRDTTPTISKTEWDTMEVINDLQDAKEWLMSDMEDGRIDSTHGYTYLMILDESIDNLISLPKTK